MIVPFISVIICTYNRADLLAAVLQSVCEQTLDTAAYEVIVVDNHSTDATADVSHSFASRYPNVRYCFEPRQGLSHARNRGWQEAKGDYVGYIDDDCKAPAEWLAVAKEIIDLVSPAMFGGPALAFYNIPKPHWFHDHYESYRQAQQAGPLNPDQFISGMNMFFEKTLLRQLGGFDPNLGMAGAQLGYGEESALLTFIRNQMPEALIYTDPRLYVYHLVRPEKMTWRWIIRDRFVRGQYEYRIYSAGQPTSLGRVGILLKVWAIFVVLGVDLLRGVLWRNRTRYLFLQNHLYESSLRYVTALGRAYARYQHLTDQKSEKK